MTAEARRLALQALHEVTSEGKYANLALQNILRRETLQARDRALCTEIVYGTVQRQRSLDALLQPLLTRPITDLDPRILTILRMTVYQLVYLDKIPPYAAINDAVELAKRGSRKAVGFVNAVLRNFLRQPRSARDRLQEEAERAGSWADSVGVLHSYPTWIIEAWERAFGRDRTLALANACNQRSSFAVRVNRCQTTRADVLAEVQAAYGDVAEPSRLSLDGIRFTKGIDTHAWTALREGKVTVQDEGAMLVAPLLQPQTHQSVLDMCAGLGTKTTHIAELQRDQGLVYACDIHPHKLQALRKAAQALDLHSIRVVLSDARALPEQAAHVEAYDAVLLDAPCTGLGVLRHRPDIRWKRSESDVQALRQLQRDLLKAAVRLVRPGGVVVYSTCTLIPEENQEVVQAVVDDPESGVVWDDVADQLPPEVRAVADMRQGCLLTPELFDTDGFYMARLRKVHA